MQAAPGIRKLGFRRWFERQLIESHLYLVTSFLCLIAAMALAEELSFRAGGLRPAVLVLLMCAIGVLGVFALNRYLGMLFRALQLSQHSICGKCQAYARFNVLDSGPREPDEAAERDLSWLKVKCRKCGHEWMME
jgi:hypothetical protein